MVRTVAILALAAGCGCQARPSGEGGAGREDLPAGQIARVGDVEIARSTVERIARAQNVGVGRAIEMATSDALLAEAARTRVQPPEVRAIERAALARALLHQIQAQAEAEGPPRPSELEEIVKEQWAEYDRPVSVRTTHAVVRVKAPQDAAPARQLAERLAASVAGETEPERFIEKAKALDAGSLEIRAERLPAVTPDGRVVPSPEALSGAPARQFDPDFARAAHAIEDAGDQSPIVETKFGYHVILLEERVAEQRSTFEELARTLRQEVVIRRARRAEQALLERLRNEKPVEIERAADDLTARVRLGS